MNRYESYKTSGVEWLGEVPSHWEIKKLKHLFVEKKHTQNLALNCGAISFGKVIRKPDEKITEETKRSYQEVLAGEFLINPLNLNYDLISLRIALSEIDVVVSAGYIVLKEKYALNKKYFSYLLHRYDVAYMKLLGAGVRQTINYNHISNSLLVFPSLAEQTAIAQYLDDKTAKIDQAIMLEEKQIELLKEHKQILIQNVVTKGLNPQVKFKDSGVEWLGEVPSHWEIKKLKHFGFIYAGINGKSGDDFSKEFKDNQKLKPFIPFTNICNNFIIDTSNYQYVRINFFEKQNAVINNDILFLMSSETLEDIAKSSLYLGNDDELYLNSFCKAFRTTKTNELLPKFLNYLFLSQNIRNYFAMVARGFTRINLKQEYVNNLPISLPPLSEQTAIAHYLDEKTAKIDHAIQLKQQQIDKLKEYKTVLINDVVTGKEKVA